MTLPFGLNLTPDSFRQFPGGKTILRRLSDVSDIFADTAEVERQIAAANPIIYEFIDLRQALGGSQMSFGLTTIAQGQISGEYYMTRGHFHAQQQDGDEVYLGVSGVGRLQLQSRQGVSQEMELAAGSLLYTPLAWAHRTINVGSEPLVFFSIWPSATAYDYDEITRRGGFPRRAVEQQGRPAWVENTAFQLK